MNVASSRPSRRAVLAVGLIALAAALAFALTQPPASDASTCGSNPRCQRYCDNLAVASGSWCYYKLNGDRVVHSYDQNYAGSGAFNKCAALSYAPGGGLTTPAHCSSTSGEIGVCYPNTCTGNFDTALWTLVKNSDNNAHNMYGIAYW